MLLGTAESRFDLYKDTKTLRSPRLCGRISAWVSNYFGIMVILLVFFIIRE